MFKEVNTKLRTYRFKIPDIDEFMELKELYTILSAINKVPEFSDWLIDYLIVSIDGIKVTKFYFTDLENSEIVLIRKHIQEIVNSLNQGKCCVCGKEIKEEFIVCSDCNVTWIVSPPDDNFIALSKRLKTTKWARNKEIVSYINEFGEVEKIRI